MPVARVTNKRKMRGQEGTKTKTTTKECVRGQEGRNSGRSLADSKVSSELSSSPSEHLGYNPIQSKGGVLPKKGKFSKNNSGKLTWALSHK